MYDREEAVVRRWHRRELSGEAMSALNLAKQALPALEQLAALAASQEVGEGTLRGAFNRADGPLAGAVSALGNVHTHLAVMPRGGGESID